MPGRHCTICQHPAKTAIDKALVGTANVRELSAKYRVSEDALGRHKATHLPLTIVKAEAAREVQHAQGVVAEGLDVVGQLRTINNITLHVLKEARDAKDHDISLKAIDRVQRQIELQAKLLGQLDERPQVNILIAPEWATVKTVLFTALARYPDARVAAAAALQEVERVDG